MVSTGSCRKIRGWVANHLAVTKPEAGIQLVAEQLSKTSLEDKPSSFSCSARGSFFCVAPSPTNKKIKMANSMDSLRIRIAIPSKSLVFWARWVCRSTHTPVISLRSKYNDPQKHREMAMPDRLYKTLRSHSTGTGFVPFSLFVCLHITCMNYHRVHSK